MSVRLRVGALMCILMLLCGGIASGDVELTADTDAMMPDGIHYVTLPAGMVFMLPDPSETDLKGIFLRKPDLEMLVFAYDALGETVETLAEKLMDAGREVEIRNISGTDFLVYQETDEADGAFCVGYGYLYNGWLIETSFFYSSQEAADLTKVIMESFHS